MEQGRSPPVGVTYGPGRPRPRDYDADVTDIAVPDARPYSPGLAGVLAGETDIALVDGEQGRLLYRGYPIIQVVQHGTFSQVCELLWTGEWKARTPQPPAPLTAPVEAALRQLPSGTNAMDALRTAVSVWGADARLAWPPTVEQARALTAFAPTALAAFARIRQGLDPIDPDPSIEGLAEAFLHQLTGTRPTAADARALDAYFMVAAEHGFNASTFAALVIIATHSDLASAVCGAIGALKGPWHGGAPAEVIDQLHQMGSADKAEAWIRDKLDHRERLMGFGHRVYRAYDPRAAALRTVAEQMGTNAAWLDMAVASGGHRPAPAQGVPPRAVAADERGVLHRGRPPGRGPAAGPVPGHVRPRPPCGLDGPLHRIPQDRQAHPPGRALHRPAGAPPPRGLRAAAADRHRGPPSLRHPEWARWPPCRP